MKPWVLGIAVLLVGFAGCATTSVTNETHEHSEEAESGQETSELPPFASVTADGTPFDLRDWTGQVIVVDFMSAYCEPCIDAIPHNIALWEKFGTDAKFLMVSIDEEPEHSLAIANRMQVPFPTALEGGLAWFEAHGFRTVPAMVVFGADGTVAAQISLVDEATPAYLEVLLARLIDEKSARRAH